VFAGRRAAAADRVAQIPQKHAQPFGFTPTWGHDRHAGRDVFTERRQGRVQVLSGRAVQPQRDLLRHTATVPPLLPPAIHHRLYTASPVPLQLADDGTVEAASPASARASGSDQYVGPDSLAALADMRHSRISRTAASANPSTSLLPTSPKGHTPWKRFRISKFASISTRPSV
jgi:hypothetical protein